MNYNKYKTMLKASRGELKATYVLKNINVINVFTEEIIQSDVAIMDDTIVGIGSYSGQQEYDMTGKYICPGFIDSHLHLESTLVMPSELINVAARWGSTTFIVDPHESANVSGCEGIDFILNQTKHVPANVYVMLPSCVPATSIDENGCVLTAKDLAVYLDNPRVLGLGEVMDYYAVIQGDPSMFDKLDLFQHKIIDGHAPFLEEKELAAYTLAGITTDHECCDFEYAMQEVRNGMYVLIREGSAAKNLEAIVSGITSSMVDSSRFCFCTDDKHIEDIKLDGHISYNVKKSIELGMDPIKAIKMATINPAICYGLNHIGAIAPGYQADFIILDDLNTIQISAVYHKGVKLDEDFSLLENECPLNLKNTVHLDHFDKNQLELKLDGTESCVVQMIDGQIITKRVMKMLPGGEFFTPNHEYLKIAVIERHKRTGHVGVGAVMGFGLTGGAIASSVSHDSHNIIVIGDNDADMALAVNELIKTQGGYTLVEQGNVIGTLPLSIMGLMSDLGYEKVNSILHTLLKKAYQMGVSQSIDPFITLSFMALPVIPEIRVTTRGCYDVVTRTFLK